MRSAHSFVRDAINNITKCNKEFHWSDIYDLIPQRLKNNVDRETVNKYVAAYCYYSDNLIRTRRGYYSKQR